MSGPTQRARALRRGGDRNNTLQPNSGICFVYIQLHDDSVEGILGQTAYTVRGLEKGTRITGTSDGEGVLRHEYLPDDQYELDCEGKTEKIETYYMVEMGNYEGKPWILRMRDVEGDRRSSQEGA